MVQNNKKSIKQKMVFQVIITIQEKILLEENMIKKLVIKL
jgi:hypothetical protein